MFARGRRVQGGIVVPLRTGRPLYLWAIPEHGRMR